MTDIGRQASALALKRLQNPGPWEKEERQLVAALLADFQIQTLRRLRQEEDTAMIRRLRRDLTVAGTAALKVAYVPPKA